MRLTIRIIVAIVGTLLLSAFTLCSLIAVDWIAHWKNYNWILLGNTGQAFGLAATMFSALGFAALVWSVNLQIRESRAQRMETQRQTHVQLIAMALQDQDLHSAWPFRENTLQAERRHAYLNLWFWWWKYNYTSGINSKSDTEDVLDDILRGQPARDYVVKTQRFRTVAADGRTPRFDQLVDERYEKAITAPPEPVSLAIAAGNISKRQRRRQKKIAASTLLGVGTVGTALYIYARNLNPRDRRTKPTAQIR